MLKLLKSYSPRTSMITADVRNIKILEMEMEQFFLSCFGNGLLSTLRRPVILLPGMNYDRNFVPTRLGTEMSGLKKQGRSPNKGMMMFGRLIGIWISQKISPAMYASVDMIICTIVISLMAIPAIAGNNLTYAVTAIYGLAMSTVYGSGVSLTATYMNVSGTNFRWHLTSDDLI